MSRLGQNFQLLEVKHVKSVKLINAEQGISTV